MKHRNVFKNNLNIKSHWKSDETKRNETRDFAKFLRFRNKSQALDDEVIRLKRSVAEWEKRYREKEHEFFDYKNKQRNTPEVKLQSEINVLTLERVKIICFLNRNSNFSSERNSTQTRRFDRIS